MGAEAKKAGKVAAPAENPWRRFAAWSGMSDPVADARLDEEPADGDGVSRGPSWLPVALLFALYGLAVLIYILIGRGQPLPQVSPDEYQYSALARSFADGNGLTYNGGPIQGGLRAALYIYAISPAWLVTESLASSYAIAKALSAAMLCTVAFPTWLVARRYMPPMVALLPAVLILAGSWMTSASQMIMENLALPLAAASLGALVAALSRPGSRWVWVALVFAVLGTWSRAQLAVLIPIVLLALVADVVLQAGAWRTRLRLHRAPVLLLAVVTLVGAAIVLAQPSVLGSYSDLPAYSDFGRSIPLTGRQMLAYITMAAVLPFILAVAVTLRRRSWDESQLRPLLVVYWVATASFVLESGILTTAFVTVDWSIQRYVEYTLPLLYVVVAAGIWRGLVSFRLVVIVTGLVAAALAFTPEIQNIQEQRGVFGLVRRADEVFGIGPGPAMASIALILGAGTALVVKFVRGTSARAALLTAMVACTGVVFAVQDQAGWAWQLDQAKVWRKGFPKDLSWIDAATDKPLARIVFFYNPFRTPQTEFFNRRIVRTYIPAEAPVGGAPVNGFRCTWKANRTGFLTFDPRCGATPTSFFQNDDLAKVTFYGQRVIAARRDVGRIVTLTARPPTRVRMKAVINPPCLAAIATQDPKTGAINPPAPQCGTSTQGAMYLEAPALVVVRFRGGLTDQQAQVQEGWSDRQRIVDIPAGAVTDIPISVPAGTRQWQIRFGWQGAPPEVPEVTSVLLKQAGTTTELLY